LLLLPPSAFFLIGLFIWALAHLEEEQVEKPAFHGAAGRTKEAY
jgi:Na+-transporting NADH:ubiquinone oxidoreductase subunit D